MDTILTTPRFVLRKMNWNDRADLAEILQDAQAMYAYEHAFSDEEVDNWLARQLDRYRNDGFGLWAVIDRVTGDWIGQCGLTIQEVEGAKELEVGYLLKRRFWHMGYAREAAAGCKDYAFGALGARRLVACVRSNNIPSCRVAESLGMTVEKSFIKHYYGIDMEHVLYTISI